MAKCEKNAHKWVLMNAGSKTFVTCALCQDRFPFTAEFNGAPYKGKLPTKYE